MNNIVFSRRHFLTRTASSTAALGAATAIGSLLITPAHAKSTKTAAGLSDRATPREVSESYWRAEAERNVDKVGLHYHPDAIFMPPGERLVGWENIRKWYEATYRQFQSVRVDIVHEISNGPEASLEWKATLKDASGKVITPIGVNIVRVDGGKFREVRAYFDSSILD